MINPYNQKMGETRKPNNPQKMVENPGLPGYLCFCGLNRGHYMTPTETSCTNIFGEIPQISPATFASSLIPPKKMDGIS